jgi:hypothetical protein
MEASGSDFGVIAAFAVVLLLVALAACYIRRAAQCEWIQSLHCVASSPYHACIQRT